jgi:hypothetical protein
VEKCGRKCPEELHGCNKVCYQVSEEFSPIEINIFIFLFLTELNKNKAKNKTSHM